MAWGPVHIQGDGVKVMHQGDLLKYLAALASSSAKMEPRMASLKGGGWHASGNSLGSREAGGSS